MLLGTAMLVQGCSVKENVPFFSQEEESQSETGQNDINQSETKQYMPESHAQ